MSDLVPLIGRDPGPRICAHCWGLGVRWRDLDTLRLIGQDGDKPSHVYAMKVLAGVDPPDLPADAIGIAQRQYWSEAGSTARGVLRYWGMPPARHEGPRRV